MQVGSDLCLYTLCRRVCVRNGGAACLWGCSFLRMYLLELMYLVFTRIPDENYLRRLRSFLLCLCDVFLALINRAFC